LEAYAEQLVKKMAVKFATGTSSVDRKLAFATLLVNAEKYDQAIVGYTALIKVLIVYNEFVVVQLCVSKGNCKVIKHCMDTVWSGLT
jgi:hypothetical protein